LDSVDRMSARILIADDAPHVRSVLKWILESHSHDWKICAEADNGSQAVQKAMETRPELVILDLQMPFMNGFSASSKIAEFLPGVPILIFTLHKSADVDQEAKRVGVREVIPKSDVGALVKAIERVLSESQKSRGNFQN
jgi:two-component system, response regulator YesN